VRPRPRHPLWRRAYPPVVAGDRELRSTAATGLAQLGSFKARAVAEARKRAPEKNICFLVET
jgi:hypothetical protein